ncbi:MAG TPA: alpha/beta hydrolase [Ramlibacter sp.]|uniref:RBBP9/YdeN family alpha/beta hydrolase n=1 Tax=Ramlibacter sp. TaxID=1917967 RepID=UPI002D80A05A|nr:alpha/beta hydrolase [Ramlibacter sp.]HET8745896.1 alpha/beta hydrolase [Ramlibacter sp.]
MPVPADASVLIVPGLRDHVDAHWQTLLAQRLPRAHTVPPLGRESIALQPRLECIEEAARRIEGPLVIVAHSAGVIMVAHWALRTKCEVQGALLATPPDFGKPLPAGYPTLEALDAHGWLPVPREPLPFPSIVAASRNDPLAAFSRVGELARDWGSELVDLGRVGHLNPASGFGAWDMAPALIARLAARDS